MKEAKLNPKFDIPIGDLEERIQQSINGDFVGYDRIVSLRELEKVDEISYFGNNVLEALIKNIPLRRFSGERIYPYADSEIKVFKLDPMALRIGQRFVLKDKLLNIMEKLGRGVFSGFITGGLLKMPPVKVYGRDGNKEKVLAFYIPPIVERQNNSASLIDGIHRSYLGGSAGTTVNLVYIKNVGVPLPFDPIDWNQSPQCDEKPPIEDRYVNLRTDLFRDLGAVGIDG